MFALSFQIIENVLDVHLDSDNIELSESSDEIEEEDSIEDALLECYCTVHPETVNETKIISFEERPAYTDVVFIQIPSPPPELA